ncbi:lauroyl acyltransferase [Marichromatium sp. AB32]|nr:lauroyl acyltransferase [Marichromatium sp. AB31]RNE90882.1 lauroyl acyltransferase [Marichromatium sp. AB32]
MVRMLIRDLLLWLHWYPLRWLAQRLPPSWLYALGRGLGAVVALLARGKAAEFAAAMAAAPALAALPRRRRWVRRAFQNRLCNELEVLVFPRLGPARMAGFVRCDDWSELDAALARGQGAMLLLAHFGANQMAMPALGHAGYRMCQMGASPLVWRERISHRRFSPLEARTLELRWRHECALPVRHIDAFGSLRPAFACLRANQVLGIAIDGAAGSDWAEVDFLGARARFSTGALRIAARTGCAVLPTFLVREPSGVSRLEIGAPLEWGADPADPAALGAAIQDYARLLERRVIAQPCHYLPFLALRRMTALKEGEPPLLLETPSAPPGGLPA